METIRLEELDFLRQLEAYLHRSDGDQLELGTDGALIRIKDLETEGIAKIELLVNGRFPVDQPPEEFEPVVDALQEVGSSFEEFDRSRNFYELTVER